MNKRPNQLNDGSDLVTVKEAAAIFRLRASTVYLWIEHRRIPFIRLGTSRIRLRRSDLELFIARGAVAADAGKKCRPS